MDSTEIYLISPTSTLVESCPSECERRSIGSSHDAHETTTRLATSLYNITTVRAGGVYNRILEMLRSFGNDDAKQKQQLRKFIYNKVRVRVKVRVDGDGGAATQQQQERRHWLSWRWLLQRKSRLTR
jgi:hypothetical protein